MQLEVRNQVVFICAYCCCCFSHNNKVNRFSPLRKESFNTVELSLLLSRIHIFFNFKEHITEYIGEHWQHIKGYEGHRATDVPLSIASWSFKAASFLQSC